MSACHYSGSSIFSRAQPSSAPAQSLFELYQSFLAPQRHQNDSDMLGWCHLSFFHISSVSCVQIAPCTVRLSPFACLLAMDLSGWHSSPGLGHVFSGLYNVIQFSCSVVEYHTLMDFADSPHSIGKRNEIKTTIIVIILQDTTCEFLWYCLLW